MARVAAAKKAARACGPLIFTRNTGETLLRPPPEYKTSIGTAEAEGIREGIFHLDFAGSVWHKIQIAVFARVLEVHGRRNNLVAQRQHGDAGLQPSSAAQQVAGHRLGGTDRHLVGMIAERAFDRHRFQFVT